MTLKEIECIISHPEIMNHLAQLEKQYPHRLDDETANSNYKFNLRQFSFHVKSAQIHG